MLKGVHVQLQTYAMNCPIIGSTVIQTGINWTGINWTGVIWTDIIWNEIIWTERSFGLIDHLD